MLSTGVPVRQSAADVELELPLVPAVPLWPELALVEVLLVGTAAGALVPPAAPVFEASTAAAVGATPASDPPAPQADKKTQHAIVGAPRPKEKYINRRPG